VYLFGRHRYKETVQRNGIWWSDDDGETWKGCDLDEKNFVDTGYGDALFRKDGTLVYLAYRGFDHCADLIRYTLSLPKPGSDTTRAYRTKDK
jgi:hypothetical protein